MQTSFKTSALITLILCQLVIATLAQERPLAALPDFTFSLTRVREAPSNYSLVISDNDEHVISATFSLAQLDIFKSVMLEAETFALNNDAVNAKEPATTRFQDRQEQALIVDVEKLANQSRLFITLADPSGSQTAEAGRIIRSTRREIGFYFDLLSRLESLLPKAPVKSPK